MGLFFEKINTITMFAVAPLAPEGSGFPSYWNVVVLEIVLVGGAEAYRTGVISPVFDELTVGDVSPGGRFDPLGLAESGDLEELKIKELKHCRLAMFAWLGCIMQALATQEGPIANWQAHTADFFGGGGKIRTFEDR